MPYKSWYGSSKFLSLRNKPKNPYKIWYNIIKCPAEYIFWWSNKFYTNIILRTECVSVNIINSTKILQNYLINHLILFTDNLLKILKILSSIFSFILWHSVGTFVDLNYLMPIIGKTIKKTCIKDNRYKKKIESPRKLSNIVKPKQIEQDSGVLFMVDESKKKIKLGIIYTKERLKFAKSKIKEKTYELVYHTDIAAYTIKEKTLFSLSTIKDKIISTLFTIYNSIINIMYNLIENTKIFINSSKQIIIYSSVNLKENMKKLTNQTRNYVRSTSLRISKMSYALSAALINLSPKTYLILLAFLLLILYFIHEVYENYNNELYHRSLPIFKEIREGCKAFILEDVTLKSIMDSLLEQIHLGLDHKTRDKSSVKCFNTYVQNLPTGKEKGKFLALDLGGTNFRVLLIKLDGHHYEMQSKIYTVPQTLMTGPGNDLFDHIANCLENFSREHKIINEQLPLGFTFSFPVKQEGLQKGILTSWTKGFSCDGVVNQDVVLLLKQAIDRKAALSINIVAILNDTTGTLMSCAWKNHNCKIGLILGTGTNACYVEKIQNVPDFDGDLSKPCVIINTEWGAFGDHGELDSITTPYDREIDQTSINPGKQRHEKMISGMYLGEIVRLLLLKFAQEKILFDGKITEDLKTKSSFKTEFVSDIESDKRGTFKNCRKILDLLNINNATDQDCANVRYVCECVSRRAANLASAGLATLLNKMESPSVTIGVDGTLYRKHPFFHDIMLEKISDLVNPSIKDFTLMLSSDGSGRGAALVAAATADEHINVPFTSQ